MDTQRSTEVIKSWEERVDQLKKESFTIERTFRTPPEELFSLICPTREYDWIPGWSCELLHSSSGYAEYGAAFRTTFRGQEELWVCTRYEPNEAIGYSITYEGVAAKLDVSFTDNHDGTVTGRWVVSTSPLTEDKNRTEDQAEVGRKQFEALLDLLERDGDVMKPNMTSPAHANRRTSEPRLVYLSPDITRVAPKVERGSGHRLQGGTDGRKHALYLGRDQILTAYSDNVSFSSLALRYISSARS